MPPMLPARCSGAWRIDKLLARYGGTLARSCLIVAGALVVKVCGAGPARLPGAAACVCSRRSRGTDQHSDNSAELLAYVRKLDLAEGPPNGSSVEGVVKEVGRQPRVLGPSKARLGLPLPSPM